MRVAGILSASTVLLPLFLVLGASPSCHGASTSHNITDILAAHPDFSEFSAALTSTGAAADINNQGTITVLALDNAVMAQLKAQQLQPRDLQHVIYLHGLTDYFDATKLASIRDGSAQATSLYQATGKAQSNEGMVSITVSGSGGGHRVGFALSTNNASNVPPPPAAIYQKSIKEVPYDIAVLQVSAPIWSPAPVPGAPAPPPSSPGHGTAPASSPAHAPPPAPAPVAPSPAHAPPPPTPAPASSPAAQAPTPPPAVAPPAIPPTPRRHPAPPQEADTPADSPDADDSEPPADQKSNGARDTASWSLGMAVAAAVPVILLLLW